MTPDARRPRKHFAPIRNWINDPNGLVAYKGKYHLYFQYSPASEVWDAISWGHATSTDLVNWSEHPVAILADEQGLIFSGSAVVDHKNSSGLGSFDNPPLVAIFTNVINDTQTQHLAYSLDEGMTFTRYEGNPVLDLQMKDFRDPKVAWFEEFNSWIMAVALPTDHKIAFFASKDLKSWEKLSEFGPHAATGGVWECPDLFALDLPGGGRKWVLIVSLNPGGPQGGSASQYFIGNFDGRTFTPDDVTERWLDDGKDFYAAVTFNDEPRGKRILIGWCNNWDYARDIPALPYRGEMALPRELTLNERGELISTPAVDLDNEFIHLDLESSHLTKGGIRITREGASLIVNRTCSIVDGRSYSMLLPEDLRSGALALDYYEDLHSIEIFVAGGRRVLTYLNFAAE